jgi:hypothetical protein
MRGLPRAGALRVLGARRGEIEERSFVAKGAPLDDGQRRVVRGGYVEAEPDRLGGVGG